MNDRKLPIGIQSFEKIRMGNYLYIDKTEFIWNLVNNGTTYFLSRPRRFGKSLLTSTIGAYFLGQKELFKGLAIEVHENEKGVDAWQKYPVIYFSFSSGNYNQENGLSRTLQTSITYYEEMYHIDHTDTDLPNQFRMLIRNLYRKTGRQVVILADEYDKPLLDNMIVNEDQEEKNRQLYSNFFSALKDEDQYIKFSFITGVTKFAKVSVFSGLNQPNDISLDNDFSAICGMTEEEIENNFQPEIKRLADEQEQTKEECINELRKMYDGYRFSKKGTKVYNPFSILNAFFKREYGSYWYSTGTPTFLVRTLENSSFTTEQLTEGIEAKEEQLTDYRAHNINPIPLFYQSGYLTINEYDKRFKTYKLSFPNDEVKYGFYHSLMPSVLGNIDVQHSSILDKMVMDVETGNIESLIVRLKALFAGIPYIEGQKHSYEQEWRNEIYLILVLMGQNVKSEVHTASGRADCVIETGSYIYVIEFKLDQSAEEALAQIHENGYAELYQADTRKLFEVGINFSSEKRNIEDWIVG